VYLGRVDPVTNEIIPKAEKGKRKRLISTNERESIMQDVREEARKDIDKLTTELNEVRDELSRVSTKLGQLLDFKKSVSEALQRVQKVD
jgi:flagellar biosynthesis chaperone FliJ